MAARVRQRTGLERPQARRPVAGGDRASDRPRWSSSASPGRDRQHGAGRGPDRDRDRHRPPSVPERQDRRFAITPRSPADVTRRRPGRRRRRFELRRRGRRVPARAPSAPAAPAIDAEDADLVDLATFVGRNVRVGGLVVDLRADGFTLDDGTATGRVVLRGRGARQPRPDRARRRAQRDRPGRDGSGRAGRRRRRPGPASSWPATPSPTASADRRAVGGPPRRLGAARPARRRLGSVRRSRRSRPAGRCRAPPGSATLAAISAASVAVTLLRRSRRAAGSGGPDRRPAGHARRPRRRPRRRPTSAERGPSTIHSA